MGGGGKLLGCAVVVGLAIIAWVLGHMVPFFFVLKTLGLFRISEEHEVRPSCQFAPGAPSFLFHFILACW